MALRVPLLALLLAGCAGLGPQIESDMFADEESAAAEQERSLAQLQADAKDHKLVCVMEKPTGSNIAERVCRYKDSVEDQAQRTQEMMLLRHSLQCSSEECKP